MSPSFNLRVLTQAVARPEDTWATIACSNDSVARGGTLRRGYLSDGIQCSMFENEFLGQVWYRSSSHHNMGRCRA